MKVTSLLATSLLLSALAPLHAKTPDGKPLVVFIAGKPSHGPGEHEHNAGVQLLAKCLAQGPPNVATKVHLNAEWPSAEELAQADTFVIYSDGQGGHAALMDDRLTELKKEMDRGAGLVCLHYAVEPIFEATGWSGPQKGPDGKPIKVELPPGRGSKGKGSPELLEWLGGYFEQFWSVNPHWTADFKELPKHPISSGVKPFSTNDEWYFYMRFRAGMKGVTPILSAIAPPETMNRPEGDHGGNPDVKRSVLEDKAPQHVAWACERENGGRGFGFTGGHFHKGWANNDQRKLVLNALLWTAKLEVPAGGVESKVTEEDLAVNLDPKQPRQPKPAASAAPAGNPVAKPVFTSALVHDKPVEIKADLKGAKELYLAVTDGGDGFVADWADWMEPLLVKADGSKIKLTELKPKSTKVGFGQFGVNKNPRGAELKVSGQPVAFGFGAHAPSLAAFDLPEGVVAFEARGGVDNGGTDQKGGATVMFQVFTTNPGNAPLASKQDVGTAADRFGLEAAKRNMSTFTTPNGLQPTLVAAEPMIQNPTSIDIDPRGRIWATECVNYRKYLDLRPEGDRVVILEDTDGDGLADKAKTFYQNKELTNPLGICVLPQAKGTKIIVSAAPNIWLLSDNDGDDVAEDAKIIFKVGGVWNYDHQIHAFSFGPDGKFYFNSGNSITDLMWPDGSRVKDLAGNDITNKGEPYRQGMVFRCDIDLATGKASNVETLGNNFRNNYKVCVDSFGTMWQSDNDDDGNKGVRINYVMDFGNYGYTDEMTGAGWRSPRTNMETEIPLQHWHQNDPGVVPNLLQTGAGSPTGI
ncbi:MAG: PVC-type heme-binding CxxCH protein, partial [Chthoniobacteraceae bacterium]